MVNVYQHLGTSQPVITHNTTTTRLNHSLIIMLLIDNKLQFFDKNYKFNILNTFSVLTVIFFYFGMISY